MDLSQNWLLMAVLTPTFWAMGCVLDCCLIGGKIYKAPSEGALISCLFCIAPAALVLGLEPSAISSVIANDGVPLTAIAAGLAYAIHLVFYFRTLYSLNDASGAETFISLSVLFVPFFAWWLLGERLPAHFYLAFLIAASGILLQCLPIIRTVGFPLIVNMFITMIAVSLSMVLQSSALDTHRFATASLFFNLTVFLFALGIIFSHRKIRRRIFQLCRDFPALLVGGEVLGIFAILSSHRATQKGPSVSIIALIECLLPLIIIAISSALIVINRHWPVMSRQHESTLALQLQGMPAKMGALTLLMVSLSILTF